MNHWSNGVEGKQIEPTGCISNPNLSPCFHAHEEWNSLGQSLQRITAPSLSLHREHLCNCIRNVGIEANVALTVVHLRRATAFKPSTNRSRLASVKVNSGVKTAQRTWAHPCPSVGLHARRKVSTGGYGFLFFSSFVDLGQRRQSWFYEGGIKQALWLV